MKKAIRKWMMVAFLLVTVLGINTSKAQGSVSLQVFYDELQPYGNWMNYGSYGYVWMPNVDRDFTPYATNGYWINTEYGNTWVSDYSWGWAPFHYGRWIYDDYYRWIWVPDTEWAPAWVAWRSGGGYYGWAPLMPGLNISVSYNYYNTIPHRYWSFVPHRYITYRTVHHHCVPRTQVVNIINHTTIVTNNYHYSDGRRRSTYFSGPSRSEIERINRTHVEVYKISDRNRPGRSDIDRGTVSFYKPEIDNSHHGRTRPQPARMVTDDRNRNENQNRAWAESRSDRTSDIHTNRTENTENLNRTDRKFENGNTIERQQPVDRDERRSFTPSDRSQLRESENNSRSFDKPRENANQDQQRSPQMERQQENRQVQREYSNPNSQRRTYENPQPRSVDRQVDRPSQHERSPVNSNHNSGSRTQPQREHHVQKSSSDHRSTQPTHSSGGNKGSSSRKRD